MLNARLSELEHVCAGRLLGEDVLVRGMVQDSRRLRPGNLFLALRGARVDGHDYLAQARELGAAAALVSRPVDDSLPQLLVGDVQAAAGAIAQWHHRRLQVRTVAITGSNGKTTVKNLVRLILEELGPTLATSGNYNNELGLPLTLAQLGSEHQYAVLEMGAGKPGDIAQLCQIARPDIAVVTNIGEAHLAQFGSREMIARTKGAIYAGLADDGTAVIPADDDYCAVLQALAGSRRQIGFGCAPAAVHASAVQLGASTRFELHTPDGSTAVSLPLLGRHNVDNALAATAVGLAAGASLEQIARGLARAKPEARRLELRHCGAATVVDDSYNANPGSLLAALEAVAPLAQPRWLVLGDMLELGPEAEALHAECGRQARAAGFERMDVCGPLSAAAARAFGAGGHVHADQPSLISALRAALAAGAAPLLLVKGSRGAAMDRVVDALLGEEDACCSG